MNLNGRYRTINCSREPSDPIAKCPLCASGNKLEYKMYIKLLVYETDENGQIVVTPRIWERSARERDSFKIKLNNYGPLSNILFRITRIGKAGDTATKYDFMELKSDVYKPENYPLDRSGFDNFELLGSTIADLTYEEAEGLSRGDIPEKLLPKTDTQTSTNGSMSGIPNYTNTYNNSNSYSNGNSYNNSNSYNNGGYSNGGYNGNANYQQGYGQQASQPSTYNSNTNWGDETVAKPRRTY